MAEEVEMIPVTAEVPPKAPMPDLGPQTSATSVPGATAALKPGLKLPPKPGATSAALRPGLKLPTQPALKPGVKLPPKPGATATALRPGLKLPTQNALTPGVKAPPRPVIRKPGEGPAVSTIAKPVLPKPVAAAPAPAPLPPDAGVPKPMEQLKSVTQKMKGLTQEIPQQAILHKTGIVSDGTKSDAQKEAAKHKTARISLADAMGVAPVKEEAAPMKTIRIKRPVNIQTPAPAPAPAPAADSSEPETQATIQPGEDTSTVTQRKTLKITRPGGSAVHPTGKFGIKRPGATAAAKPAEASAEGADGAVSDIAEIPEMPAVAPAPVAAAKESDGPAWLWTLSMLVQLAACVAIGALAWFLYQNTQTAYF